MVAGCKIFMKAEGIPRDEEEEVHLVELRKVVGCKRESQTGKACGSSNGCWKQEE
ncbi:hypothetical protein A2U01_0053507, partial [Trifolium medium]|nr:hypothetical protein [Trifolium medium]